MSKITLVAYVDQTVNPPHAADVSHKWHPSPYLLVVYDQHVKYSVAIGVLDVRVSSFGHQESDTLLLT